MARKNQIRGSKKGRQSLHNKATGKYVRQRARKARRLKRNNK